MSDQPQAFHPDDGRSLRPQLPPGWDHLSVGERLVSLARRCAAEHVGQKLREHLHEPVEIEEDHDNAAADPLLLSLAEAAASLEKSRRRVARPFDRNCDPSGRKEAA